MPWDLIVAAGVAIVNGIANVAGSVKNDQEAVDELDKQKKLLEEEYLLNLEKAEQDYNEGKAESERNANRKELEADLTDTAQDITEVSLSTDVNAAIDNLFLNQAADTYSWNNSIMQAGSNSGASYANLAASGVRAGSSLSDAILMESATNSSQLQFSQDAKRRSDNNQLGSVLNQLAGNKMGIMSNRIGADINRDDASWLRNSWLEGGYNYNLYELQKKQLETNYNYNLDQIKTERGKHTGDNRLYNGLSAFFGGASSGFTSGYNLYQTVYKANPYKTDTTGGKEG